MPRMSKELVLALELEAVEVIWQWMRAQDGTGTILGNGNVNLYDPKSGEYIAFENLFEAAEWVLHQEVTNG